MTDLSAPHAEHCFGCGPDNDWSIGVRRWWDGQVAFGELDLGARHQGYPGYAHGGVIAAAFDDVMGTVPLLYGLTAVTGTLQISFRQPARLDRRHLLRAELARPVSGRRVDLVAEMRADGELVAESEGTWVIVEPSHFDAAHEWQRRQSAPASG